MCSVVTSYFLVFILFVLGIYGCNAQSDSTYTREVTIGHDNDYLVLLASRDRYYTYGLDAGYKWLAGNQSPLQSWFPQRSSPIHSFSLHVKVFTPEYNKETGAVIPTEERPYAGYSFINYSLQSQYENKVIRLGVDLGVMGPSSQADEIQDRFHAIISEPKLDGWNQQLEDAVALNLRGSYIASIYSNQNFELSTDLSAVVGTI